MNSCSYNISLLSINIKGNLQMNFEIDDLIAYLKKLNVSESEITELLKSAFGADQRTE